MNDNDLKYLEQHMRDCGRLELRSMIPGGAIGSGLFDDVPKFATEVHELRNSANLYHTIQAPKLRPALNQMGHAGGRDTLSNVDIGKFTRLVFDLDVVRDVGQGATLPQIEEAIELATKIRGYLYKEGFPFPVMVNSGNGIHMVYRTPPIPNCAAYNDGLKILYDGLAKEFGIPEVTFDTTVRSAGQILRIPGSYNLKVPTSPRMCQVIDYPRKWMQVNPKFIVSVARVLAPEEKVKPVRTAAAYKGGSGDYRTLNVVEWFRGHGKYIRHVRDNTHAVHCPWIEEHTTPTPAHGGDTCIFENDGDWPGFFCHHSHCGGRGISEVMEIWGDADAFCTREWRAQ